MNKKGFITTVVTLFFLTGMLSVVWFSGSSAFAQTINSNNQTTATSIDQLTSNLTAARESIASGNTTATTAQLTAIIGELSDILGTVTSDTDGAATDEHTHFFTHKDDTHTVTHKHPHHPSHHHDWFEKHHIFNPSDCKPGLMC
jgi:outer membrane murein-binding lipoprotein Lpp